MQAIIFRKTDSLKVLLEFAEKHLIISDKGIITEYLQGSSTFKYYVLMVICACR